MLIGYRTELPLSFRTTVSSGSIVRIPPAAAYGSLPSESVAESASADDNRWRIWGPSRLGMIWHWLPDQVSVIASNDRECLRTDSPRRPSKSPVPACPLSTLSNDNSGRCRRCRGTRFQPYRLPFRPEPCPLTRRPALPDYRPQPAGVGPTRVMLIVPEAPALLPPVKLKSSFRAVQLMNVAVIVPTGTVAGVGAGLSNSPPVVS